MFAILLFTTTVFSQDVAATSNDDAYHKVELYFGLTANGKKITQKKWQQFVAGYITSAFPEGLTIVNAYGQWRTDEGAVLKEGSRIVILVCRRNAASEEKIAKIKDEYKKRFNQQSVLEVNISTEKVVF